MAAITLRKARTMDGTIHHDQITRKSDIEIKKHQELGNLT